MINLLTWFLGLLNLILGKVLEMLETELQNPQAAIN